MVKQTDEENISQKYSGMLADADAHQVKCKSMGRILKWTGKQVGCTKFHREMLSFNKQVIIQAINQLLYIVFL